MGRMRIAFAAVLVAILGAALPSRAAVSCALTPTAGHRYIDIDVLEQGFSPMTQQAFAGDIVRWTVRGSASQFIQPYAPKNVPGFGGQLVAVGDVYCITFGGGSVWYRDARSQNSTVNEITKVCHGRCASISDRTADPAAPSVTPPSGPSEQRPTPISGTSEPLTLVKIASVPSGETAYDKGTPLGQALADETGVWNASLDVTGGSYNLVTRAVDAGGRESVDSTAGGGSTVTLQVIQDTEPPVVTATKPTPPVIVADTPISGTATDNAKVSQVAVVISDLRNGANILGDSGQTTIIIKREQFNCSPEPTCPLGNVGWKIIMRPTSKLNALLPGQTEPTTIGIPGGLFNVRITAYDAWLNASVVESLDVLVVPVLRVG